MSATGLAPAPGGVPELDLPAEPADLRADLRRRVLEEPGSWAGLAAEPDWLVDRLWPAWGGALSARGWDRADLGAVASGYRRELWLWVVGERRWRPTITALAGRVARRAGLAGPVADLTPPWSSPPDPGG